MSEPILVTTAHLVINALNRSGVEYALCGGLALAVYGAARATDDIDFLIGSGADLIKIDAALAELNPLSGDPAGITFPDGMTLHRRIFFRGKRAILVDFLTQPPDVTWLSTRQLGDFAGAAAWVIGKDALLAMKRLAGRPQDLADIARLEQP